MVTMLFMNLLFFLTLIIMISSINPVKMSLALISLCFLLMMQLFFLNATIWMSMIFFMIFIGGIMVMFMILSSLLPNEKSLKMKNLLMFTFFMLVALASCSISSLQYEMNSMQETKLIFLTNQSFEMVMMVIFLYFLSFLYIISKDSTSLRSFMC